ncbi:MAG: hypothetical protein M0C28_02090 [Candidatus Moduliflexus flocculans]|nr:hypothetical protein [Candidatus Moduliflexus flocculans]
MVNTLRRELTLRQAKVLKAVEDFILGHGYAPTIRQLGAALEDPQPLGRPQAPPEPGAQGLHQPRRRRDPGGRAARPRREPGPGAGGRARPGRRAARVVRHRRARPWTSRAGWSAAAGATSSASGSTARA